MHSWWAYHISVTKVIILYHLLTCIHVYMHTQAQVQYCTWHLQVDIVNVAVLLGTLEHMLN